MDKSQPRWAAALGNNAELREEFAQWVADRVTMYAKEGTITSRDMSDVLGFRFMIGELEALVALVFWNVDEEARRQHAFSELVEEDKPVRKRRRRR